MIMLNSVLKTASTTIDLFQGDNDNLRRGLNLFIQCNLGVDVDTRGTKSEILKRIEEKYTERAKVIQDAGLVELMEKLRCLDRNKQENKDEIQEYISKKFGINMPCYTLSPRVDAHQLIDYIIAVKK